MVKELIEYQKNIAEDGDLEDCVTICDIIRWVVEQPKVDEQAIKTAVEYYPKDSTARQEVSIYEKGSTGIGNYNIGIALLPLQSGGRYRKNDKMRLQITR